MKKILTIILVIISTQQGYSQVHRYIKVTYDSIRVVSPQALTDSLANTYVNGLVVNDSTLRLYRFNGDSSNFVIKGVGGSAGTTSDQTLVATGGQTAFTFTSVPASYADYIVFVNGSEIQNTTYFTTSGNVITFTTGLLLNDRVRFKRIK